MRRYLFFCARNLLLLADVGIMYAVAISVRSVQEEETVARRKGLTFYQKKKRLNPRLLKDVMEMLVGGAVAVFLAFVLVFSVGMRTSVIGDSMEPSLHNGQEILMNRILYRISKPRRGDVVVFLPNGNQNTHFYVKRVVGLPGETVQIRDGSVYIDGVLLEESELFDKIADPGIAQNELLLEGDEFFVLGDNRNSSEDSRSGNIGAVKRDDIVGKAWFHMAVQNDSMGMIE